jgi:hypothetical protein
MLKRVVMNKYVLKTDERMPSKRNLWALEAAGTPEEARKRFRRRIESWHCSVEWRHLRAMADDRERRLREDDFEVELL